MGAPLLLPSSHSTISTSSNTRPSPTAIPCASETPSPPTLTTLKPLCLPLDKQRPSPPLPSPTTPPSFTADPPRLRRPSQTPPSVGSDLTRSTPSPAPLVRPRPTRVRSDFNKVAPLSTRSSTLASARITTTRRQRRAVSHMVSDVSSNADQRRCSHLGAFRAPHLPDVVSEMWSNLPLAPYRNTQPNVIVLFTNAIRSELNDMKFLLCLLRDTTCSNDSPRSLRNLNPDFELWFSRFSHFVHLIMFCVQTKLFTHVEHFLNKREVMTSRCVASTEVAGMSYMQAWKSTCSSMRMSISQLLQYMCTAENRVLLLTAKRRLRSNGNRAHLLASACESLAVVHRAFAKLLNSLDTACERIVYLKGSNTLCKQLLEEFVCVLVNDGARDVPALGWSAGATLTRWIEPKKMRSEMTSRLARIGKVSVLGRCLADQSHHAVVRIYRLVWAKRAG
ncbi:unnamed protein product [Agarophyton chilense]|eukprot:gb/GEZJ01003621.1/.p1 GENE.gb/GEZJ01003621.1/~~gb/GEZJ01003621.1/.p1  ORF type:complete len:449 (-),score=37.70 gb/GEZJ01003621.1/:1477-2823(-)